MSEKSRIRWLCRRGMRELDILLERFVDNEYNTLSARQHTEFVKLLHLEDPDLWMLLMGRMGPENPEQSELLGRIRQFKRPPGA